MMNEDYENRILSDEMIRMFYEKPEFGNCELCGRYDKLVPGEKWCFLCNETEDCLEATEE